MIVRRNYAFSAVVRVIHTVYGEELHFSMQRAFHCMTGRVQGYREEARHTDRNLHAAWHLAWAWGNGIKKHTSDA